MQRILMRRRSRPMPCVPRNARALRSSPCTGRRGSASPAINGSRSPMPPAPWPASGPAPAGAVAALGTAPRRVFVALGRNALAPFVQAPQHHYLIRSVDPVGPPLPVPHAAYITGRGPFEEADERALMVRKRIALVVSKNSGGEATYGKIAAARALGLPVIMLRRHAPPCASSVTT